MAKHRTHSIEFKRQVVQEYLAGETLHGLAKRHDLSRNLVRIWIQSSGPCLAEGDEERIFLPFVSEWGGGGKGLWLSRLTILKQGGELRAVRRVGKEGGTTFLLLLEPLSSGQGTSHEPA